MRLSIAQAFGTLVALLAVSQAEAAMYRVVPSASDIAAGATAALRVEVVTEPGDNLVGFGHFAFAVDLVLGGTAVVTGADVHDVVINHSVFDDTASNKTGSPIGAAYRNVAGVTTDVFAPNAGYCVGEVVELFTFDLSVPAGVELGQTITVTPSEGFLENLTVTSTFAPVAPQHFAAASLQIVPEPQVVSLVLMGVAAVRRRRGSRVRVRESRN